MKHRLRHRYGRAKGTSWQGLNYIENRYYAIQPSLAGVALGSGPLSNHDVEMLKRGHEFLMWLDPQAAPRSARGEKKRLGDDIRRLVAKAAARQ